jgi:hypothetical protein
MTLITEMLQTATTDESTSVEGRNVACVARARILKVWTEAVM